MSQLTQHQHRSDLVSAGTHMLGRTGVPRAGGCRRFGVGGGPPSARVEKRSQWSCCAVERGGPVCQNGRGFRAAGVLDLAAQRSQRPSREFQPTHSETDLLLLSCGPRPTCHSMHAGNSVSPPKRGGRGWSTSLTCRVTSGPTRQHSPATHVVLHVPLCRLRGRPQVRGAALPPVPIQKQHV